MRKKTCYLLIIVLIATNLLWYLVFETDLFNFWIRLTSAVIILNLAVIRYQNYNIKFDLENISKGIISAVLLYFIFWIGKFASEAIFSGSQQQIASVYSLKIGIDYKLIALVLLIVGAGEELFWRGFLQQKLSEDWGVSLGYLITSLIYGLVHLWTGNLILVLAALTAGLFWGYLFWRNKSLSLVILSHVLWDLLIFIMFPLNI